MDIFTRQFILAQLKERKILTFLTQISFCLLKMAHELRHKDISFPLFMHFFTLLWTTHIEYVLILCSCRHFRTFLILIFKFHLKYPLDLFIYIDMISIFTKHFNKLKYSLVISSFSSSHSYIFLTFLSR